MEDKLENILKEIWYSGKNDSQVFDFFECIGNQRWLERIYQLFEPDEVTIPVVRILGMTLEEHQE